MCDEEGKMDEPTTDEQAEQLIRDTHGNKAAWLVEHLLGIYRRKRKIGLTSGEAFRVQNNIYLASVGASPGD